MAIKVSSQFCSGKIAGAIKGKTIVDKVIKHAAIILVRLTILVT